jgi:Ca2+-transporting ATPase
MPIVFDALELLNIDKEPPKDVEEQGFFLWLKYLGIGIGFMLVFLTVPVLLGFVNGFIAYVPSLLAIDRIIEFFMIAAVLIVVAVPEGLVMSVVLSLSYSMRKMKLENTLVRKLSATETMGAATVICTDKTGTLTENKMSVSVFKMQLPDIHNIILESIAVNSTASLDVTEIDGKRLVKRIGNHTEAAIIDYLHQKHGFNYEFYRGGFKISQKKPFSTEYKYMATFGESTSSGKVNYIKGAPEVIIDRCSFIQEGESQIKIDSEKKASILSEIESYQKKGHRVLCFAHKQNCEDFDGNNYAYLGFVAISDPLRKEVAEAMCWSVAAGIDVKIISGDALLTTQTIAEESGIWSIGSNANKWLHLSGEEFRKMTDEEVLECCKNIKIISRAKPEDKKRLVTLLQRANEIVAVTGDGVNDAPALKSANVGLSMGSGTDLAQEASKIVIINDSFFSIMNGVKWGRSLYHNIQRFILFQLTINVATLTIAMIGPFIGLEIPLTAVQLLWINLIMDTFGALALATEAPSPEVMREKPRDSNAFIVTKEMTKNIFSDSLVFVGILLCYLFYSGLNNPSALAPHELIYKESIFFTLFVLLNFWNLFNAKVFGMKKSVFSGFFENKGFLIIASTIFIGQILMIQFGGDFFRTIPLKVMDWVFVIGLTSLVLWFGEVKRLLKR